MIAYLDTSGIIKLVAAEEGWQTAERILGSVTTAVASSLVHAEVLAGLAAARRGRKLTQRGFELASARMKAGWRDVQEVTLDPSIARAAAVLADRQALRAADAVHLATALAVNDPRLVMVTWDARLHAAAGASGLAVAPADP